MRQKNAYMTKSMSKIRAINDLACTVVGFASQYTGVQGSKAKRGEAKGVKRNRER